MRDLNIEVTSGSAVALPIAITTVDEPLLSGGGILLGYSLRESTGAAIATAELRSSGNVLWEIALAAGAADGKWFGDQGILIPGDLTLHIVAGSVVGAVHVGYDTP